MTERRMERDAIHASPLSAVITGTGRSSFRALASILRRPGLTWALTLALVGWSVAGVAVLGDVHEHQVARSLAAAAGFTAVPGPGIEIVLTDATSASSS